MCLMLEKLSSEKVTHLRNILGKVKGAKKEQRNKEAEKMIKCAFTAGGDELKDVDTGAIRKERELVLA